MAMFVFGLHVKWFILLLDGSEIIGLSFDFNDDSLKINRKFRVQKVFILAN